MVQTRSILALKDDFVLHDDTKSILGNENVFDRNLSGSRNPR